MLIRLLSTLLLISTASPALAQARHVVGRLSGFACMSLKVTDRQAMDPSFVVPLKTQPSASASDVGRAAATVFVRSPVVERNGYIAAILFNGQPGWISANALVAWHSPGGPAHECIPSRMSDGSIGLTFR